MAISIFPSTAAEFVSNNFVVDMNDTSNNTADTGGVKQAGPYSISFSSGDSSFDVYLIDNDGNSVGYSNNTSIVASGLFTTVVILGVAQDEVVSFLYQGSVNNADGEGDEPGAGAYLESISPSDLPSIDDTATVTGGNFGADTEIKFESGATSLEAKNITVNNSTELIVTRPDNLDANLDPWTLRAVTTGVPEPTGSNANLLVDEVTAGAVPSWTTTSPLATGTVNVAYTDTLEATDAEGDVTYSITSGSLPAGLSLDSSTGVISGTPTAGGQIFTATATDDGGNQSSREFGLAVVAGSGGTVTVEGGKVYHTFTATDDFVADADLEIEFVAIAGGGGAGQAGGGAGGLLQGTASLTAGTYTATIGAGGGQGANGSNSVLQSAGTAIGGGGGSTNGNNGGSGGGALGSSGVPGTGTAGQGNDGGLGLSGTPQGDQSGGGGGAGQVGGNAANVTGGGGAGGNGIQLSEYASATSTGAGGYYAGGGGGRYNGEGGLGGGGDQAVNGTANTGGGGGREASGGSGLIMVRY